MQGLAEAGYELVSTGGSAKAIEAAGVPVKSVDQLTGFPEMLDGVLLPEGLELSIPQTMTSCVAEFRLAPHELEALISWAFPRVACPQRHKCHRIMNESWEGFADWRSCQERSRRHC